MLGEEDGEDGGEEADWASNMLDAEDEANKLGDARFVLRGEEMGEVKVDLREEMLPLADPVLPCIRASILPPTG